MSICENPIGGDTTEVDSADLTQFDLKDDVPISTACAWIETALGIQQTSNAWGNAYGDNTLMGRNALYNGKEFTDFIAEVEMIGSDNDGVGFNFGWRGDPCGDANDCSSSQRYTAHMINDQWPSPPADGVGGPHMKIKRMNGKPCTANMMGTSNCFDTLSFLNGDGHFQVDQTANAASGDATAAGAGMLHALPSGYAATIQPYPMGITMKLTLIVKNFEARLFWSKHDGSATIATVATLPASYNGGHVGFMLYAHQATFTSFKITDIGSTASTMPTGYCTGGATCGATGICLPGPPSPPFSPPGSPSMPPKPPSPPPPPESPSPAFPDTTSSQTLSEGETAGVIVGVVAAVVIIGLAGIIYGALHHRKVKAKMDAAIEMKDAAKSAVSTTAEPVFTEVKEDKL
jgi:hypothetical protein